MTPEPDTPPTLTPDTNPLGDLVHAALQSKKHLGEASASTGTFTHPCIACLGLMHPKNSMSDKSPERTHFELNLWTLQVPPPTRHRPCLGLG